MKRAMKGDFDLFGKAAGLYAGLDNLLETMAEGDDYYGEKSTYTGNFKKAILICIHGAVERYGRTLVHQQEVLNNIADMIIETYLSESLRLRVQKLESLKSDLTVYRDILDVNIYDAASRIRKSAHDAIYAFAEEGQAENLVRAADTLTAVRGVNVKSARRRIADKLIEDNAYKF
jgi:hypothetical protein